MEIVTFDEKPFSLNEEHVLVVVSVENITGLQPAVFGHTLAVRCLVVEVVLETTIQSWTH